MFNGMKGIRSFCTKQADVSGPTEKVNSEPRQGAGCVYPVRWREIG